MADGTAVHSAPTTIPLIVPAMYTHLMAARSKVVLTSQLGKHKLDFCLMFLKTFEENYPAAGIVRRLFLAAVALNGRKEKGSSEVAVAADIRREPTHDYLSNDVEFLSTEAHSPQSIGFGLSGFALLPVQGGLFEMGIDETDQYVPPFALSPTCPYLLKINHVQKHFIDEF